MAITVINKSCSIEKIEGVSRQINYKLGSLKWNGGNKGIRQKTATSPFVLPFCGLIF